MKITALLMIGILALLCSCGGGGSSTSSNPVTPPQPSQSNPTPSISSLSPNNANIGAAGFTLTVIGSNFVSGAAVLWNAAGLVTTFVSASQLTAAVPATVMGAAGTVQVTVFNPAPGGGTSNDTVFTIKAPQAALPSEFAYVVNSSCLSSGTGCVYVYAINPNTGALHQSGSPVPTGNGPVVLAATPTGRFLYVGNSTSNDISMFGINASTGALSSLSPATVGGGAPEWMEVHPSGKFAYFANDNDTAIDVFALDPASGQLAETSSVPACINSIRTPGVFEGLDPSGKFAYIAQGCSFANILTFSIDQSTGALTQTSTISGPSIPVGLAVHPSGNFVYFVSSSPDQVAVYTVNLMTGELMLKSAVATGASPSAIAIDPAGKFAYIANSGSNTISEYAIDPSTGALAGLGTASVVNNPVSIAIEQSGRFLYVVNASDSDCSFELGGSVQSFGIGATGTLTPIGTKVCADVMATQIATVRPTGSAGTAGLTGTWQGSWASSDGPSGSLTASLVQNGSALSGTANITNSPCFTALTVSGSVTATTVVFGSVSSGGDQSSFSGTLNTDGVHINGTYAGISGPCAKDTGKWSLAKP
jgi:6-phosphogluconolactonase (cycloisomerase 2 family)